LIVFKGAKFTRVKALREMNFGSIEGMRHDEIIAKFGRLYKDWLKDPYNYCLPKAEPMNEFQKRVKRALGLIASKNRQKTVAVVCHGGVIGTFVGSLKKNKNFWKFVPKATSVTIVKFKDGKPRVIKFNDTKHLG
jgi:broad specificity phosphatase PhoE